MHLAKPKTGLIIGVLLALLHFLWSILVATGVAQTVLDWVYKMHFLDNPFQVQQFDIATAAMLVVLTFVIGFVAGWILALVVNMLHKK